MRKLDIPGELAIALAEISEPLLHSGERDTCLLYSEEAFEIARDLLAGFVAKDRGQSDRCLSGGRYGELDNS